MGGWAAPTTTLEAKLSEGPCLAAHHDGTGVVCKAGRASTIQTRVHMWDSRSCVWLWPPLCAPISLDASNFE